MESDFNSHPAEECTEIDGMDFTRVEFQFCLSFQDVDLAFTIEKDGAQKSRINVKYHVE